MKQLCMHATGFGTTRDQMLLVAHASVLHAPLTFI